MTKPSPARLRLGLLGLGLGLSVAVGLGLGACAEGSNCGPSEGVVARVIDGDTVDLESGERRWKRGRYGHGQTMRLGDRLLIQAENGDLAWVATEPEAFRELARLPALDGKTWNHPALAMPYLIVRNDRLAQAYRLVKSDS